MPLITEAFSREELKIGATTAIAVHPNGRRLYVGRRFSTERERFNLGVLKLDARGIPQGAATFYPDCDLPLPIDASSSVIRIHLHRAGHKLYIASFLAYKYFTADTTQARLTVYDLNAQGDPVGLPHGYDTGSPANQYLAITEHPSLDLLYVVGDKEAGVNVFHLKDGEPQPPPQLYSIGNFGKGEVSVSPDGKRLYLGTLQSTPPHEDALEIVKLDTSGAPEASSLQSFLAGHAPPVDGKDPGVAYLQFHYTPKALYRRHPTPLLSSLPAWPLVVWPLDAATGAPKGSPQTFPQYLGRAFAVDKSSNHVWIAHDDPFHDTFTKELVRDGVRLTRVALNNAGLPTGDTQESLTTLTKYGQEGLLIDSSASQRAIMVTQALTQAGKDKHDVIISGNEVRDYFLRVTIKDAQRKPKEPVPKEPFSVSMNGEPVGNLSLGQLSRPVDLNPYLRDKDGQQFFRIIVLPADSGRPLDLLKVSIEIYQGNRDKGGRRLWPPREMVDIVQGNRVAFLLPGYRFLPPPPRRRLARIEMMSQHSKRYLNASKQVAVKQAERPKQFSISCYGLFGSQGDLGELTREVKTLANLGFNTGFAKRWHDTDTPALGGLPILASDGPNSVEETLKSHGWVYRTQAYDLLANGSPPPPQGLHYFDFYHKKNPTVLHAWAAKQPPRTPAETGGAAEDVVEFQMVDEPGWYYPDVLEAVKNDITSSLLAFRAYLQQKGFQPGDFGQATWDTVVPTGASAATAKPGSPQPLLERRKLYYWTMRFFTESCSRGFALASTAIKHAFKEEERKNPKHSRSKPLSVYVDWGYFLGKGWYTAMPNETVGEPPNQRNLGPDGALGIPDWLDAGRHSANMIWTEDANFSDQSAQLWSFYGDALRSAASLSLQEGFGAYVKGNGKGTHPEGVSYAILSLIGHGAKSLSFWYFGPRVFLRDSDAWSENLYVYRPLADAMRLVGRAEKLLYPGRPSRGKVALLWPGTSHLWEQGSSEKLYQDELQGLHFALVHAGYTVDFVDDTDIANGELQKRRYTTLYITGPNVSKVAQLNIVTWVDGGGVLAVTPGAATADEYNEPSSVLDKALGLGLRPENRVPLTDPTGQHNYRVVYELILAEAAFGWGTLPLFEPVTSLPLNGAKPAGTLQIKGGAAISRNAHGDGHVVAYGFFPGQQYLKSPNRDDVSSLPSKWGSLQRSVVVAPAAMIADTPKPVHASHELVEACKLECEFGTAIVLLNWSDVPIPKLVLSLSVPPGFTKGSKVSSAQGVKVERKVSAGVLHISLPVQHVDVVMIE